MTESEILAELKKLTKIITLGNAEKIELEIGKYATTEERKNVWCLVDGKNTSDDIAKIINKTKRTVDVFLDILEQAKLIEERKYGIAPKRVVEHVPSKWLESLSKKERGR